MKLKIKKTGELLEDVKFIDTTLHKIVIQYLDDGVLRECSIKSLSDVEEIKDYEEQKVSALHLMIHTLTDFIENEPDEDKVDLEDCKQMLGKLKAWKRLKDKGFKFTDWNCPLCEVYFEIPDSFYDREGMIGEAISEESSNDLDLLFGGGDDRG